MRAHFCLLLLLLDRHLLCVNLSKKLAVIRWQSFFIIVSLRVVLIFKFIEVFVTSVETSLAKGDLALLAIA